LLNKRFFDAKKTHTCLIFAVFAANLLAKTAKNLFACAALWLKLKNNDAVFGAKCK